MTHREMLLVAHEYRVSHLYSDFDGPKNGEIFALSIIASRGPDVLAAQSIFRHR